MDSKITFFFLSLTIVFNNAAALNITALLDKYPSFSTFNDYLTRTRIAGVINSHQPPITVLAVDNSNLSLSGKLPEVLRKIVSVHVILDYFDTPKLQSLGNKSVTVATLFQTSGEAVDNQGYVNITGFSSGSAGFGSAAGGRGGAASAGSVLVKTVVARPYDFSVLQISNAIVPPGIDNSANSSNSSSPSLPPVLPVPVPVPVPAASPITPPAASPTLPPAASPVKPPAASPITPPAASPVKPPAASPTTPPAASPTTPPAASPIKPPAPSPRKIISPAPAPAPSDGNTPSPAPNSAPTPTPANSPGNDESSGVGSLPRIGAGVLIVPSTLLFLVFMV